MNTLYIAAKLGLGHRILIVNKSDLPFIGKERAVEVMCIQVNLQYKMIDPIIGLEEHFKFNPWEGIIDEEERNVVWRRIKSVFSDEDISEKIVKPLAAHMLKHAP